MARASEPESEPALRAALARRELLLGAALLATTGWWAPRGRAAEAPAAANQGAGGAALDARTRELLATSPYVYISPLRSDGTESTCHGEVWFGWLDEGVVVNTRRGTWKVRALERGLDRARIWVGDHGPWRPRPFGAPDESFRTAPHFDARARFETDRALLDRLLALYEDKYGSAFRRWREDMRTGFYAGQRRLIRYTPL